MKKYLTTLKSLFFVRFSLVRRSTLFLILCSFSLIIAGTASAQIIYVTEAGAGDKKGSSWDNAIPGNQLEDKILTAGIVGTKFQFFVAKGIYKPQTIHIVGGGDRDRTFFLQNNVEVYGGFEGKTGETIATRNIAANPTILSGTSDNSYHVVVSVNNNASAVLDGFIIENGNANMAGSGTTASELGSVDILRNSGAGIYNHNSSPILCNLIFRDNIASSLGGGMFNTNTSTPQIINSVFYNNTAAAGGAIFNHTSSPAKVINCTISGNKSSVANATGSAIGTFQSGIHIVNSIIYDNEQNEINNELGGSATITYSLIKGGYMGTGNLPAGKNPFFTDGAGGIFTLKLNSPALNVGNNAAIQGIAATDINGTTRILNTTVDMGAYENFSITGANGIIYVKQVAGGNSSGDSWANATPQLADAMEIARTNMNIKQIYVAAGTYKPSYNYAEYAQGEATDNRDVCFLMRNDLALYGGFKGLASETIASRKITDYPTILSGNINQAGDTDNTYHVLVSVGNTSSTILDGFIIEKGNADMTGSPKILNVETDRTTGGAMFNTGSSPTLRNNIFRDNSGSTAGAISNHSSSPNISATIFSANKALVGKGGAIVNDLSSPSITNTLFYSNTATTSGGAIYNSGNSSPKIINSTFSTNTAQMGGSAIANGDNASLSITNSILYGDTGGEISNTGSATATISYSLVQGGAVSLTHVIDEDPQFENTAAGNFNLKAGSPAINAGSKGLLPPGITTDLAGKPRIQDSNIDMGAYESGTVAPPAAVKGILYVTEEGAGDMSGKNWKNAVNGLGTALEKAKSNLNITEAWVAKGVYYPTVNPVSGSGNNRDKTFLLRNSLILYGGFAGVENKVSQRNIGNNPTILSGNFGDDANADNNAYHVIISSGNSSTTILDGFIVEEGNANVGSNVIVTAGGVDVTIPRNSAGGIFNRTSSPILRNIIFRMNKSTSSGGAMVNSTSSSPTMINTVFYKNSTGAQGGAIYNTAGSSPVITNSTFNANTAVTSGGAIFNTISTTITNSILYGNLLSDGTVSNITGTAVTTNSLVNVNPLFENAAAGDLRLQPISPAINKGNSLSIPADITTDVAGNQRIYGTAVDMGAYESASYGAEKPNTPITNILSPNGDGINDFLVIQDADQYKNQLVIWNRAGQVIYSQTDYKNNWDGTINGTPVIEDAYFFAIVFSGPDIDKKFTGSVTVLRN